MNEPIVTPRVHAIADAIVTCLFSTGAKTADRLTLTIDGPQVYEIGSITKDAALAHVAMILTNMTGGKL